MKKAVSVELDNKYSFTLLEDSVTFFDHILCKSATLPIEYYYQMWNSEEMSYHMEDYHKRRQTQESVSE